MVADGKVKLKHGTIKRFVKKGIEFEDGTFLPADVIVCATGVGSGISAGPPTHLSPDFGV
jgi:putative flavoprotein involved in K+ transport